MIDVKGLLHLEFAFININNNVLLIIRLNVIDRKTKKYKRKKANGNKPVNPFDKKARDKHNPDIIIWVELSVLIFLIKTWYCFIYHFYY